jgi:hypothetical protein
LPRFLRLLFSSVFLLGPCVHACLAPQTEPEPRLPQRDPLAEVYLHKRLAVWQHRLALDEWHISMILSPSSELRKGTLGNIHWDGDKKSAVIRVLDASEYHTPYSAALKDMEFTVVHELIHLDLARLPHSEASRGTEEQAVNRVADALLHLDRQEPDDWDSGD